MRTRRRRTSSPPGAPAFWHALPPCCLFAPRPQQTEAPCLDSEAWPWIPCPPCRPLAGSRDRDSPRELRASCRGPGFPNSRRSGRDLLRRAHRSPRRWAGAAPVRGVLPWTETLQVARSPLGRRPRAGRSPAAVLLRPDRPLAVLRRPVAAAPRAGGSSWPAWPSPPAGRPARGPGAARLRGTRGTLHPSPPRGPRRSRGTPGSLRPPGTRGTRHRGPRLRGVQRCPMRTRGPALWPWPWP